MRRQQQQQQQQRQLFSEVCEHINAQNQVEAIVHEHVTQQETIANTIQRMQQDEFVIAHLSSQQLKSENQNGNIWSCSVGGLMIQQGNTEQYIEELRRGIEQYQATIETCEQKCRQLRQQWRQLDPHDQFQLKHLMFPPNTQWP